jgi:hypothetical protein
MSQFFLIGGFVGFALAFFASLHAGTSVHVALRNGMLGCLLLAILTRYFFNKVALMLLHVRLREIEREESEEATEP